MITVLIVEVDSSKAKKGLGYQTRPFAEIIYDEVESLKAEPRIMA